MTKVRVLISAILTTTTISTYAQLAPSTCTDAQAKNTLFNTFIAQTKGGAKEQRHASATAKAFIEYYGNCPDPFSQNASNSMRQWLSLYTDAKTDSALVEAVNTNPAQAFAIAQPLLADRADDLQLNLMLLVAGIKCVKAGDRSHDAEALAAAKRALDLVSQGKTADEWAPFTNAQDAPDGLRYYIAFFDAEKSPDDAIQNLVQVAKSKSSFSRDATTYQLLGAAYYKGEVARLAAEYKSKYEGKPETPESKALLERVNQTLDKVIDAYARAVALSDGNTSQAAMNASARKVLSTVYAQRHDGSTDGMDQIVSKALTAPLP